MKTGYFYLLFLSFVCGLLGSAAFHYLLPVAATAKTGESVISARRIFMQDESGNVGAVIEGIPSGVKITTSKSGDRFLAVNITSKHNDIIAEQIDKGSASGTNVLGALRILLTAGRQGQ